MVAIIVFGINSGAYVTEIIRGGILSIDKGQLEAARSLGLSYSHSMKKVILPQTVKVVLPSIINEFIALLKETSVAGFITVIDLTNAFRLITSRNLRCIYSLFDDVNNIFITSNYYCKFCKENRKEVKN